MQPLKHMLRTGLHPRLAIVFHDLFMVWLAWGVAHLGRYFMAPGQLPFSWFSAESVIVLVLQGLVFWGTGLYRGLWRFASLPDLANIIKASVLGTLVIALALVLYNRIESVPRTVFFLYPLILTVLLGGPRILYRLWKDNGLGLQQGSRKRVLILGAGRSADMLVREIRRDNQFEVVGFLDDNPRLHGARMHGIRVLGDMSRLPELVRKLAIEQVLIAIPSATDQQMQRMVALCERAGIPFLTLPKLGELVAGAQPVTHLKEVAIEDLLGRECVQLDWDRIAEDLSGQCILVTGGGGSIGSELCRQLARISPGRLVILEHSEHNLYEVERRLRGEFPDLLLDVYLGDVCDHRTCEHVFRKHLPEVVFHAAAYKHVPLLENQVRDAVFNNVLGTRNVADAADRYGTGTFVLISTDKAVNPTNVMGATKRLAEKYCQLLDQRSGTRFITVRFGNVLNSAGSVVPLFQEQIRRGGPVTVTHPEVTRYFMTIPEAAQLIMQAAVQGEGGEIFVLDMGEPVRIQYLAEQMIRLAGKRPGKDIEIVYTGLRPGEKLYEELFHESESCKPTRHNKILLARSRPVDPALFQEPYARLRRAVLEYDTDTVRAVLCQMVPEFQGMVETDVVVPIDTARKAEAGT